MLYNFICKFDSRNCNSAQNLNNDECQCECENIAYLKKLIIGLPTYRLLRLLKSVNLMDI